MGLMDWLLGRSATPRGAGQADEPAPEDPLLEVGFDVRPRPRLTVDALAAELHERYPDGVDVDTLWGRCKEERLDVQDVDRAIDALRFAPTIRVRTLPSRGLDIIDLTSLDSVRTRIVGSAYALTDAERSRYGGRSYLLVREPDNPADALAVAVYGRGRQVGYLTRARAARLAPIFDALGADAYRVSGTGVAENSITMWIDVPKAPAMRAFVEQHTAES